MATWMKSDMDVNVLLLEAAQIDPYVGEALSGTGPFEDGMHLMHVVADICWNPDFDIHRRRINQTLTLHPNEATWMRKGEQVMFEEHIVYGSKKPGFSLTWNVKQEGPQGPREWKPGGRDILYMFMLTVSREKGTPAMKKVAKELDWELVSG